MLLFGCFLVTSWLLTSYCLFTSCLLLGYFLVTSLLRGYFLVTSFLLYFSALFFPGYSLVIYWLLSGYCMVTFWLLPCYFLVTACLLPGYCLVTSWLLPGCCLFTSWLLPDYFLVSSLLLRVYFLVTFWLLLGYFLVTTWLLTGYYLVISWSSVSPKDEICFLCACAIAFQLTSTFSPSVAQHVFTSCYSVSCSVNPDLYRSRMFITVHTAVRTYTKISFGNRKREVRACPLVAFQCGGHFQKLLPRELMATGNFPDYCFWHSLHNFSS